MIVFLELGCSDFPSLSNAAKDALGFMPDRFITFDPIYREVVGGEFIACAVGKYSGHNFISMTENPALRTFKKENVNFDELGAIKKKVKMIDFPRWVQENLKFEDTIICKMAIEGMEYELLEALIQTRDKNKVPIIGWFDYLFVEFNLAKIKEEHRAAFVMRQEWILKNSPTEIQSFPIQMV